MSGTKDLRDLLDRLKGEVGPLPQAQPEKERSEAPQFRELPPRGRQNEPQPEGSIQARFIRPYRAPERSASLIVPHNQAWSENKESILFGMLASLIAALGGILAGFEYLVLIGAVFFSFFSLVMLLVLSRMLGGSGRHSEEASGVSDRIDALSRKVEMLSSRAASSMVGSASAGAPDRELEHKVEELRVLVKTLAKAVDADK